MGEETEEIEEAEVDEEEAEEDQLQTQQPVHLLHHRPNPLPLTVSPAGRVGRRATVHISAPISLFTSVILRRTPMYFSHTYHMTLILQNQTRTIMLLPFTYLPLTVHHLLLSCWIHNPVFTSSATQSC